MEIAIVNDFPMSFSGKSAEIRSILDISKSGVRKLNGPRTD